MQQIHRITKPITDGERLGQLVGHVSRNELDDIDRALRVVLALD